MPASVSPQPLVIKADIAFKREQTHVANRRKRVLKFDHVWFSLVVARFPEAVPPLWGPKEKALAKHLTTRIGAEHIMEFVKWAVDNWTAVIGSNFRWLRDPAPQTPALPFLVKFVHVFNDAKEKCRDHPLQPAELVRALNMIKKTTEGREGVTKDERLRP